MGEAEFEPAVGDLNITTNISSLITGSVEVSVSHLTLTPPSSSTAPQRWTPKVFSIWR